MASPKWSLVTLSQCQPGQIAAADDDNDNVAGTGLTFLIILAEEKNDRKDILIFMLIDFDVGMSRLDVGQRQV